MRNETVSTKILLEGLDELDKESKEMIVDLLSRANIWANGIGRDY
jgi:hypothetical protein